MTTQKWNWQLADWPNFIYNINNVEKYEHDFLQQSGVTLGINKHLQDDERQELLITLISNEALKTSEIEGEILDRESLQSSIKKQFGLQPQSSTNNHPAEQGIAEMMGDLYKHFNTPLTHQSLWAWHAMLMNGRRDIHDIGCYRTHKDAMQIVSGALHKPVIHYEAPPSDKVHDEMEQFIIWFNDTSPSGKRPLSPLIRSAIAHLYFVSIHPFEDGNGRIGRALIEKVLAQHLKQPTLVAISQTINDQRQRYYDALVKQNHSNMIDTWLIYCAETLLAAQTYTIEQMEFILKKTSFFDRYSHDLNSRQLKAIKRIFQEGIKGFDGGLSAKNYIAITKTSASTATRDLQGLVDKNIFTQTGTRKSTRYWLKGF